MNYQKVTKADVEMMLRMKARGRTMTEIAEHMGFSRSTVRYHIDEKHRERAHERHRRTKADLREAMANRAAIGFTHGYNSKKVDEDWRKRLAEVPKQDNRDLTGRTFGDPLPERSALAQRRAAQ